MSDDLSPVEQARAARWSVEWLENHGWLDQPADASRVLLALRIHADTVDPPETVESLRAERNKALTKAKTWEDLADGWRDRAIELRGDVREAEAIIARLRATHGDAARGRCSRED